MPILLFAFLCWLTGGLCVGLTAAYQVWREELKTPPVPPIRSNGPVPVYVFAVLILVIILCLFIFLPTTC